MMFVSPDIHRGKCADLSRQNDWQKLLYDPAKKGTLSILQAAAKEASVQRVVITSSVAAVELKNGKDRVGRK